MKRIVKVGVLVTLATITTMINKPIHKTKTDVKKIDTREKTTEIVKENKKETKKEEIPLPIVEEQQVSEQVSDQVSEQVQEDVEEQIQETNNLGTYKVTHYGPNCNGGACSGITASGYDVRNTIYYNDSEYGQLRIVATSRDIPLYTVIRIKDYKVGGDTLAIVLDRGVSGNVIDLLVSSEEEAYGLGIQYTNIEIVREG